MQELARPTPLPDGFTEEETADAIRQIADSDHPGVWLLFIGPSGSAFALVAQGKRFTDIDQAEFRADTLSALPELQGDAITVERTADDRAMLWRFDPPLDLTLHPRFHLLIAEVARRTRR